MLLMGNGKRAGLVAVRIAIEMMEEGLITKEEAIFRPEPDQLVCFVVPRLDEKDVKLENVLAKGLPASPGGAVGQIAFTAEDAVKMAGDGTEKNPVILVRAETSPEDIKAMSSAPSIFTPPGARTCPA